MLRVTLCFPDINLSAVQRISFTTLLRDRQSHSGGIGGGGREREIDLKQEKNEKEGELKKRQSLACFQTGTWWDFILPSIQGVLPVGLRQPYPASLIRIRTWPYVIRWVMYSHKSMFLIAFGCIAREVTEHRVYVCSLSFDILCGRCTTAS